MFTLGAYVVASLTADKSYENFVTERIFKPLDMSDTTFSSGDHADFTRLSQSWTLENRRIPNFFEGNESHILAGPGGIISTISDMVNRS